MFILSSLKCKVTMAGVTDQCLVKQVDKVGMSHRQAAPTLVVVDEMGLYTLSINRLITEHGVVHLWKQTSFPESTLPAAVYLSYNFC